MSWLNRSDELHEFDQFRLILSSQLFAGGLAMRL